MSGEQNMKDLETIVTNLTGCTRQIANTVVNAIIECIDKDNEVIIKGETNPCQKVCQIL